MSDFENGQEQLLSNNITQDDVKLIPFEKVSASGTISKLKRKANKGYVFGEITIEYLDFSDQKVSVTGSIYEGEEGKPMVNSARRQYNDIMAATDTSSLDQIEGRRVKFTAEPRKKDNTQPIFTEFSPPE